jgi:metal-responsive CopG/Arc/MetJ family transcriptional regulator
MNTLKLVGGIKVDPLLLSSLDRLRTAGMTRSELVRHALSELLVALQRGEAVPEMPEPPRPVFLSVRVPEALLADLTRLCPSGSRAGMFRAAVARLCSQQEDVRKAG